MKTRFFNGRLSYSLASRTHGNVLVWVKPAAETERSKRVSENILRWQDDGGPVLEKTGEMVKEISRAQPFANDSLGG